MTEEKLSPRTAHNLKKQRLRARLYELEKIKMQRELRKSQQFEQSIVSSEDGEKSTELVRASAVPTEGICVPFTRSVAAGLPSRRNTLSPRQNALSSHQNTLSPRHNTLSPRHNTLSPRLNTLSPRLNTLSPRHNTLSPRLNALSPRQTALSPRQTALSPRQIALSPRQTSRGCLSPGAHSSPVLTLLTLPE